MIRREWIIDTPPKTANSKVNMEAILYPQSESKYGTTRENTWRYHIPKRLISYLLSKYCCRFYALLLRREKQSKQRSGLRDARVGLAH